MRVRVYINIDIDPEEYPIPSDGRLDEEIQEYIKDLVHEIDGIKITNMRTIMENKKYD